MMNNSLEIENLVVYLNDNKILDNINLNLEEGTFLSIIGPNGSGKTTLLKTITGLIKKENGSIKLFGKELNDSPMNQIAYVPQIKTLDRSFPALAVELVVSGFKHEWTWKISKDEKNKAIEILERLDASHLAYKSLNNLSGGELQRIFLARSLIRMPRILLLDEPATGIDLVCELSINNVLSDYNKNLKTTIIMVTHDWSSAYHHTNMVLMLNRKQIFFGDSKSAFTEENLQKTFSHIGHKHGVTFGLKELI